MFKNFFIGTIKITHSGEVLIWLVIILAIVAFSSISNINKIKNLDNDYQIFLQDVDGLIVGSPVRMMGIQVGHITKITPTNNEVYVKFILTDPTVYIPRGTSATVEFSGLAGSKSLELYLPQEGDYVDKDTPILAVDSPKRLHDALSLLNEMFKKLGSIIYTTSSFGTKLEEENLTLPKTNNNNIGNFIKFSDSFIDSSTTKTKDLRNSLERLRENAK